VPLVDVGRVSRVRHLFATGRARRMREKARLSIRELASAAGVSPSSLHRWETGQASPSPEGALAWAEAMRGLGLPV
jgi:transcriptional regulator with XRE-family HTH domain